MSRVEPKQRRAKLRHELIIVATRMAVRQYGRDNFTTSQVAKLAGVSVGLIYRYFDNRADLLRAAYPNLTEGLGE